MRGELAFLPFYGAISANLPLIRPSATFPRRGKAFALFLLLILQNLLRDLAAVAAGIHRALLNKAVGLSLGHALFLDQVALCAVNKPQLALLCMICGAIVTGVVAVALKKLRVKKTDEVGLAKAA